MDIKVVDAEKEKLEVSKYSKFKLPGSIGKKCKKCGADHWMFMWWNKNNSLGVRCAKCVGKWSKAYKKRNPDKYREYAWKDHGINITIEEYRQLEKKQNSCCAICGKFNKKLRVDHCHKTGKVRGLLCSRCNALALDIETTKAVLFYLEGGEKANGNQDS
jgi:hypothetical protein